jgi:YgiT-type zinc finger domain-containing protein
MAESRECPLCGDVMQLKLRDVHERVPGHSQVVRHIVREWICPGCDYYEEDEDQQPARGR